jgi:paraquat-inducible protein B
VKEILIHFNQQPSDASLPVIIELNENLLTKRTDDSLNLLDETSFQFCLKRGLRGKLQAQSLLTGLLYVELDFLPQTAEVWHQLKPLYKEIPTAPTEVQIFRVDFAEVAGKLNLLLSKLDKSLNELHVREISIGLTNVLASLNAVAASPDLTNTITSAHETLIEVKELAADLRRRTDALSCSAESTLSESRQALRELRGGIQDVRDVLTPDGTLRRDVNETLESLSEAARNISALADFLNKHPNALISGKRNSEAKR